MSLPRKISALMLGWALSAGACAYADTTTASPAGLTIESTGVVGGDLKIYTGPVTIDETASEHVHVEAQPGQLLIRKVGALGGEAIGATPFDPTTESLEMVGGDVVLKDALGHSLTIHPASGASVAAAQPASSQPAAADDADVPQPKKPRRVDAVTDRGHVIP